MATAIAPPQVSIETRPPRGALLVLLAGVFTSLLDFFIVNVALPDTQRDLHAGPSAVQFIVAGYGLALAAGLITAGRLGDMYGRRKMYVLGLGLFTLASAACGLAPSAGFLVAARVVQGARRRPADAADPCHHQHLLHRARAGPGIHRLRDDGRLRRGIRPARRRCPHQGGPGRARLAVDLPDQHPDRRGRGGAGAAPASRVPGGRRRPDRSHRRRAGLTRARRDRAAAGGGAAAGLAGLGLRVPGRLRPAARRVRPAPAQARRRERLPAGQPRRCSGSGRSAPGWSSA